MADKRKNPLARDPGEPPLGNPLARDPGKPPLGNPLARDPGEPPLGNPLAADNGGLAVHSALASLGEDTLGTSEAAKRVLDRDHGLQATDNPIAVCRAKFIELHQDVNALITKLSNNEITPAELKVRIIYITGILSIYIERLRPYAKKLNITSELEILQNSVTALSSSGNRREATGTLNSINESLNAIIKKIPEGESTEA